MVIIYIWFSSVAVYSIILIYVNKWYPMAIMSTFSWVSWGLTMELMLYVVLFVSNMFSKRRHEQTVFAYSFSHFVFDFKQFRGISLPYLSLQKYMPDLASLFSHVVVDVSSVKALCIRWYPRGKVLNRYVNYGSPLFKFLTRGTIL